ncbi:MAG TPA: hypothetical protein VH593_23235 [Ktedonobacteraceae bacterium]|jgi:hypothetical protein
MSFSPDPPWSDGQSVTRVEDGVLFFYEEVSNSLKVQPNIAGIIKDANGFTIQNLPLPRSGTGYGGDVANRDYVDSHSGTGGGIPEAPTDGGTYARESSAWVKVYDGGAY